MVGELLVTVTLPFTSCPGVDAATEATFRALEAQGQELTTLEVEAYDPTEGAALGPTISAMRAYGAKYLR